MAPIAIDISISDSLQAIEGILERREHDRDTVWDSLASQLKAVSLTVSDLDRMYFVLLAEVEDILHRNNHLASVLMPSSVRQILTAPTEDSPCDSPNGRAQFEVPPTTLL